MISIVVCSISSSLFDSLEKNVSETIGIEYEVIKIDNSKNKYSISAAYNKGASLAKYPYLLFVHEDVLFKTQNWGQLIIDTFNNDVRIGLLGVAGGVYKSKMVSGWWQSEANQEFRRMNIIQYNKKTDKHSRHIIHNPLNETLSEVVALDGVFLATKKSIWANNKFDEQMLQGFHGYDLDFSLQIFQQYKVVVVHDILLEHYSGGTANGDWLVEIIKVHKKWKSKLPLFANENTVINNTAYKDGLRRLRKHNNLFVEENKGLFFLIKYYNIFFSFLDCKPSLFTGSKDYLLNLKRLIQLKFNKQN